MKPLWKKILSLAARVKSNPRHDAPKRTLRGPRRRLVFFLIIMLLFYDNIRITQYNVYNGENRSRRTLPNRLNN